MKRDMDLIRLILLEIEKEEELLKLDWNALPQPVMVLGGGSNLLFTDNYPGTVLHIAVGETPIGGLVHPRTSVGGGAHWIQVPRGDAGDNGRGRSERSERSSSDGSFSHCEVTVPAGVVFDDFCAWAASEGLWGPENLSLIPGECGASAVQNIGAYGVEAKDIIAGIRAYDRIEGRFVDIDPADCQYGYRSSRFKTEWKGRFIITAVTYRLSKEPNPILDYGGVRRALEERGVREIVPGACPPPDKCRGRGPLDTSPEGTQETMGWAGTKRSEVESPGTTSLTPQVIRDTIIEIRRKKLPDPAETGSAGSFFCNPVISRKHFEKVVEIAREDNGPDYQVPHYEVGDQIKVPAAWMIEQCGFKGRRLGGAQVYPNQPLVIVNASGEASPEEIIGLEKQVIDGVQAKYGITLHPEVEHV